MRTARTLVRKHHRILTTLVAVLLLWVSGASSWSTRAAEVDTNTPVSQELPAEDGPSNPVVLTSLEAVVTPIAKIQLTFFSSFILELALVEEVIERVAVNVSLPQSNYLRTLFRLIISPNAP